jgi:hypothetical protein
MGALSPLPSGSHYPHPLFRYAVRGRLGDMASARSSGTRHLRKARPRSVTGKSNETHGWRMVLQGRSLKIADIAG